jgi:hypothetical protein
MLAEVRDEIGDEAAREVALVAWIGGRQVNDTRRPQGIGGGRLKHTGGRRGHIALYRRVALAT